MGSLAETPRNTSESTVMIQEPHERRRRERVALRCTAYLFPEGISGMIRALTKNVCSSGLYCHADVVVPLGDHLRCLVELSPATFSNELGAPCLDCQVEVLRIDRLDSGFGIGCRIHKYRLVKSQCKHPAGSRNGVGNK